MESDQDFGIIENMKRKIHQVMSSSSNKFNVSFSKKYQEAFFFCKSTFEYLLSNWICPARATGRPKLALKTRLCSYNTNNLKINELHWKFSRLFCSTFLHFIVNITTTHNTTKKKERSKNTKINKKQNLTDKVTVVEIEKEDGDKEQNPEDENVDYNINGHFYYVKIFL